MARNTVLLLVANVLSGALATPGGIRIGAIEPTTAGQIGINPADLPVPTPAPSIGVDTQYLTEEGGSTSWIASDSWFTTIHTTTTRVPDNTPVPVDKPKGFSVVVKPDGTMEITMSKAMHDLFESIGSNIPACAAKRLARRAECELRRLRQFSEAVRQNSEIMEQVDLLAEDIATQVGGPGYAAELAGNGQMLGFVNSQLITDIIAAAGEAGVSAESAGIFASIMGVIYTASNQLSKLGGVFKLPAAKPSAVQKQQKQTPTATSSASSTSSSAPCPTEEKRWPSCSDDACKADDGGEKCKEGKWKDCDCKAQANRIPHNIVPKWTDIEDVIKQFPIGSTGKPPDCNTNALSGIPTNIFKGDKSETWPGVYTQFCQAISKAQGEALSWTVDVRGKEAFLPRMMRPRSQYRSLEGRTPPPSQVPPDAYDSYRFRLEWKPSGTCDAICGSAYDIIAGSTCGQQGGFSNAMTASATLDVGCGQYVYTILGPNVPPPVQEPPPPPPPTFCYLSDSWPNHGPVDGDILKKFTQEACEIWKDDEDINSKTAMHTLGPKWEKGPSGQFASYSYGIYFNSAVEECRNSGKNEKRVSMDQCKDMLFRSWDDCQKKGNGGTGGWFDVGCVRYEFRPAAF